MMRRADFLVDKLKQSALFRCYFVICFYGLFTFVLRQRILELELPEENEKQSLFLC